MRVRINDDAFINQKIISSKQENWWEEAVVQYGLESLKKYLNPVNENKNLPLASIFPQLECILID